MKSDPLKFLNDDEFYRWMAVCDKGNYPSEGLLSYVTTAYARKQHLYGNNKLIRKRVLAYINKNLTPEEFERFVKKTQKANIAPTFIEKETAQGRMKNIGTGEYSKANRSKVDIVKFELIDQPVLDKKPDDVVNDVKIDEVLPVVDDVKVEEVLPVVDDVKIDDVKIDDVLQVVEILKKDDTISANSEIVEKFRLIEKIHGGTMKEGSR
jgi:hypothetical protein